MSRVFANGLGDRSSIPVRVISKTLKMVLDTYLLNTQQYKVCIMGKLKQSREWSSALPYTSVLQLLKRSLLVALDYGCQLLLLFLVKTAWTQQNFKIKLKKKIFRWNNLWINMLSKENKLVDIFLSYDKIKFRIRYTLPFFIGVPKPIDHFFRTVYF